MARHTLPLLALTCSLSVVPAFAQGLPLELSGRFVPEAATVASDPMLELTLRPTIVGKGGARVELLSYPDEDDCGGKCFLTLSLKRVGGAAAGDVRGIHPARFRKQAVSTPAPVTIATDGRSMPVRLKKWFALNHSGEYELTATYKIFGEAVAPNGKRSDLRGELTFGPVKFSLHPMGYAPVVRGLFAEGANAATAQLEALRAFVPASPVAQTDPTQSARIAALLESPEPKIREAAVGVWGRLDLPDGFDRLVTAMKNAALPAGAVDTYARALAQLSQGENAVLLGAIQAYDPAHSASGDDGYVALVQAVFENRGPDFTPFMRGLIAHTDARVRALSARFIREAVDAEAVEPLRAQYSKEADRPAKLEQITALGYLGDSRALPEITEALQSKDEALVVASARVAGALNNYRLADALIPLLEHPSFVVREKAFPALKQATGVPMPYFHDAPAKVRREQVQQIRTWWQLNRANFEQPPQKTALGWALTGFATMVGVLVVLQVLGLIKENRLTRSLMQTRFGKLGRRPTDS